MHMRTTGGRPGSAVVGLFGVVVMVFSMVARVGHRRMSYDGFTRADSRRCRNSSRQVQAQAANSRYAGTATSLPEREHVDLNIGVEERDLEGVLGDRTRLADELVEPLFDNCAVAIPINVNPPRRSRRVPVEEYLEPCGGSETAGPMTRLTSRA